MATLKHIASKNSDYTAIEAYLVYQHDAFTGKQLLDEQGKPKLRDSYLLDTLECGDFSFATACLLANRKYGKNTQHGDIKSHQYIISFDPRDAADNGLTMEKAQALGLKFCEENFPGHPAIVCTHPDGHNHSGNIHVHIVIGSVRTREVERKPYMQKPRDWREGMKHSSTAQTMRHLRVAVMEMCQDAKLYQIDLLSSKKRVSEREYWMKRRSQMKLDRENAALLAAGQQPTQTEFETAKETLRKQISDVLDNAASFEDTAKVVEAIHADFGRIDILVNNAGITRDGLMMRMTEQQWDMVINVNLKSAFNFIHACTPIMMRQKGGSIINMASVVGVHGNAGQANYSASKAGMIALAKSIAQELGSRGIRANAIAPGFIMTAMTDALSEEVKAEWCKKIPLRRGGTPEDVANIATFLASDMSSYVSGQVIQVDGGMNM